MQRAINSFQVSVLFKNYKEFRWLCNLEAKIKYSKTIFLLENRVISIKGLITAVKDFPVWSDKPTKMINYKLKYRH